MGKAKIFFETSQSFKSFIKTKAMKLFLSEDIQVFDKKIGYEKPVFLAGSCFANNIGEKLDFHQFDTCINSHGIVFNPLSLAKSLTDVLEEKQYNTQDLNTREDIYFSYHHHGEFSSIRKNEVLDKINNRISKAYKAVENASHLIITFGTAWVYELIDIGEIVANCHKMPSKFFKKRLLTIQEIKTAFLELTNKVKKVNPDIAIVYTVSPVRHIKDGLVENARSKAILLEAVHQIREEGKGDYFPAYEIMMDELRDYRFYKQDLIHPNDQAIDYIWDKFQQAYFTDDTKKIVKQVAKLKQQVNHRFLHPDSNQAKEFQEHLQSRLSAFHQMYPHIKKISV